MVEVDFTACELADHCSQDVARDAGAIDTVIAGMKAHPADPDVVAQACGALYRFGRDSVINQVFAVFFRGQQYHLFDIAATC